MKFAVTGFALALTLAACAGGGTAQVRCSNGLTVETFTVENPDGKTEGELAGEQCDILLPPVETAAPTTRAVESDLSWGVDCNYAPSNPKSGRVENFPIEAVDRQDAERAAAQFEELGDELGDPVFCTVTRIP